MMRTRAKTNSGVVSNFFKLVIAKEEIGPMYIDPRGQRLEILTKG